MKRKISVLLVLAMLLSCLAIFPLSVSAETPALEVDGDGYYKISSLADLKEMAKEGVNPTGKYRLYADLDMTGYASGTDLAADGTAISFKGEFDGQDHKFTNLTGTLFKIAEGAVVKNFTVDTMTLSEGVTPIFGSEVNGGTAGITIQNVTNKRSQPVNNAAGTFAKTVSGKVTLIGCVNEGNLTSPYGSNNHKVGGFFNVPGVGANVTFTNCTNKGNITSSQAGGFLGTLPADGCTVTFTGCTNLGTISGVGGSSGYGIAGGLIGSTNNGGGITKNMSITITNCVNTGDILRADQSGQSKNNGIGGFIGVIGNNADTADYTVVIDNCVVKDCRIDAMDENNTATPNPKAGGFIGAMDFPAARGTSITIKNSLVENIILSANSVDRTSVFANTNRKAATKIENCAYNNVSAFGKGASADVPYGGAKHFDLESGGYNLFASDGTKVTLVGAQMNTDSTKVRFVGKVDGLGYEYVGMMIKVKANDKTGYQSFDTDTVYKALVTDFGANTITAASVEAEDLFALTISDLDAAGEYEFTVTPYGKTTDGAVTVGAAVTFTLSAGAITAGTAL